MYTECFPVWQFIKDEIDERGWSAYDLAERMGGDWQVNLCMLELMQHCGESHPQAYMAEETAAQLALAFGTSAEMWLNLDRSYRACREARAKIEKN